MQAHGPAVNVGAGRHAPLAAQRAELPSSSASHFSASASMAALGAVSIFAVGARRAGSRRVQARGARMQTKALRQEMAAAKTVARKTQCLHPDKPMMFACADCPRRNSKAATEANELGSEPMAVAAFVGEEVASTACGCARKTQCLHPDKPMMFSCADCPRRNSKAATEANELDSEPMAVAAFVGEEVASTACGCARKTQCLHPDKPMMFACADCPRRNSKAATEANELDSEPMAVAAFVGEEVASTGRARKTQCLHPDKPMMFACADCPRRNSKAATEANELDSEPMAVAAFVGEEVASTACGCARKTQCLHPDKPMMFACADCPRRNSKAATEANELDSEPMAVAAFVGEEVASTGRARKTQCLHPDKPMMFSCADCPRRNSKAATEANELDSEPMAVAAFVGEEVASTACGCARKTQCLHPDKPMMFACADCPRRNSKAATEANELDSEPMAVAAFVGEEVASTGRARKTQCLHQDKPMMFSCADCPRRNSKAATEANELDSEPMAVAAFVGEEVASTACGCARKTQCLHPDKPMMFACADCPRRNSKAATEANELDSEPMAVAAFVGEEVASTGRARKTQCLHPDKPMMFACADCPRRTS